MKNYLLLLLSSALVLPVAGHAKGPIDGKIYGKINVAVLSDDNQGISDTYVESHASRLGFKGKTALDNGMSVIYTLEYEINPTEKNASKAGSPDTTIFKQRNAIVGLETVAGTIVMGTHDTPMKMAQGKIDLFNDLTYGDIKNIVLGEERMNDIVMYRSPALKGFALNAAVIQDEDTTTKDNGTSMSVTYQGINNLYLAAAFDSKIDKTDVTRFVAQYKLNDLTIGALLNASQAVNTPGSKEESSAVVSASYTVNHWKVKAQFGSGNEKSKGLEQVAFGVDYKLGKKSKLYFYSASLKNDDNSTDKTVNGLGIEHKF